MPNLDHGRGERRTRCVFPWSKLYPGCGEPHSKRWFPSPVLCRENLQQRRWSPWALNRGNLCCVTGHAGNRYTSILRNKRRCSRPCWRRTGRVCRTAVELSFPGSEGTWLARVWVCARVVGNSKALCKSRSGGRRYARVGHHHDGQTCLGYRDWRCDYLTELAPDGSLAIELNDCDDFSYGSACEKNLPSRRYLIRRA